MNAVSLLRPKKLAGLISRLDTPRIQGEANRPVTAITYDSRQVKTGALFVARTGSRDDGHRYITDAVNRGAGTIVHERDLPLYDPRICYLQVRNVRTALAAASSWIVGDPAHRLNLIGVTGTDGKSSTAWFTKLLIDHLGMTAGLISSVYVDDGVGVTDTPWRLSTPEAPELHGLLASLEDHGRQTAVIEATSIALATGRLDGLSLSAAVITNVTHEHLEFHGDWERYRDAKATILGMLAKDDDSPGIAVLNRDDAAWDHLHSLCPAAQSFTTKRPSETSDAPADCTATVKEVSPDGLTLSIDLHGTKRYCRVPIGDPVQTGNIAAACLLAAGVSDASPAQVLDMVPMLRALPGRMQPISNHRGLTVIVDHAHTPAAFKQLFSGLLLRREGFGEETSGRIIAVFGSAGEKDRQKRPMQGRVASEYADLVILADEDPRGEDPMRILSDIASGFVAGATRPHLIPDRRAAIAAAIEVARPGDTLLLLGKGHEQTIEYANYTQPWDEVAEARTALET